MEKLLRLAGEIRNKYGSEELSKYKIGFILEKLSTLDDIKDLLKSKTSNIRFKDYINCSENYVVNYEYFVTYYNDEDSLLCFNLYYLNKELLDLLESLKDDIFKIEDIDYLFGDSYYDSISNIIDNISQSFSRDDINFEIKGNKQLRNLVIFADNLDEVKKMSLDSKSGMGDVSLKRSMSSILTLLYTRYNDPQFSRLVHKIKAEKSKDLRLTSSNILGERYTSAKTTKVAFFKLPIIPDNLEILKNEFDIPNLEYIYYVTGFGNFNDIGIEEHDMYKRFIAFSSQSEPYFQKLVDLVSVPLKKEGIDELVRCINDSNSAFNDMRKFNNEREL